MNKHSGSNSPELAVLERENEFQCGTGNWQSDKQGVEEDRLLGRAIAVGNNQWFVATVGGLYNDPNATIAISWGLARVTLASSGPSGNLSEYVVRAMSHRGGGDITTLEYLKQTGLLFSLVTERVNQEQLSTDYWVLLSGVATASVARVEVYKADQPEPFQAIEPMDGKFFALLGLASAVGYRTLTLKALDATGTLVGQAQAKQWRHDELGAIIKQYGPIQVRQTLIFGPEGVAEESETNSVVLMRPEVELLVGPLKRDRVELPQVLKWLRFIAEHEKVARDHYKGQYEEAVQNNVGPVKEEATRRYWQNHETRITLIEAALNELEVL